MGDFEDLTSVERLFLYTFHVVGWFWNTFTFYPWYFLSGNYKQKRFGCLQGKSISGKPEGPYRCLEAVNELTKTWRGHETLDQLFK